MANFSSAETALLLDFAKWSGTSTSSTMFAYAVEAGGASPSSGTIRIYGTNLMAPSGGIVTGIQFEDPAGDEIWGLRYLFHDFATLKNFMAASDEAGAIDFLFSGDDHITDTPGNDTLWGGPGNDELVDLEGIDVLYGGTGFDFIFLSDTTSIRLDLGAGTATNRNGDTITLSGVEGFYGGAGSDTVLGDGNANTFYGHTGNDQMWGGSGDDYLEGGGGNDTLQGGEGVDLLSYRNSSSLSHVRVDLAAGTANAGSGNDVFNGMENLWGGTGHDTLSGDAGGNAIDGFMGNDTAYGAEGDDELRGGAANDTVYGGGGDDTLYGGTGADTLYGGTGPDTFVFSNAGGRDLVGDFVHGSDKLSVAGLGVTSFAQITTAGVGSNLEVTLGSTGVVAILGGLGSTTIAADDFVGFGAGPITGNGNANTLSGGESNDRMYGLESGDTLIGNGGDDLLDGGTGGDTLDGGAGNDTADYSTLTNALNIQLHTSLADAGVQGGFDLFVAIENAVAGLGDDQIWGDGSANVLSAGAGNDWLHGFLGNDTLFGGSSNDQVLGGGGIDSIYGGAGNDFLWFDNQDAVFGGDGNDYAYLDSAGGANIDLALSGLEGVSGLNDGDTLDASGTTDGVQLIGFGARDTLIGGSGSDYIYFDELDTVQGNGGFDFAFHSNGNGVTMYLAASGIEQVYANIGNDFLDGSGMSSAFMIAYSGSDTVLGGAGNDYIWIDWTAADTVLGGAGRDEMYHIGTGALDLDLAAMQIEGVLGGAASDRIDGSGQTQAVLAIGLGGNDTLLGSTQDTDVLYGDDGNDTLRGGAGNDYLFGGAGSDTFVYTGLAGGNGADFINDFATGDKVLVSGNAVVTGLGSSTVVLTDGSTLMAANGYNWLAGDFI